MSETSPGNGFNQKTLQIERYLLSNRNIINFLIKLTILKKIYIYSNYTEIYKYPAY